MKLSNVIEGFFIDRSLELAKTTIANYRHYLSLFNQFVGDVDIEDITSKDVTRFLNHLLIERGLSKRSVHDVRARLSSLYRWANSELGIENIISKVRNPKFTKKVIEPFTPEELKTLVSNLDKNNHRFNAIFLTLLDSGLRVSELTNLTIADYQNETGKLFIRSGKGDKDRIVYLGNKARKAIWRYLADCEPKPHQPLFTTGNGTKIDRNNVRRDLINYGKQFGIHANPHKFRHTFAVNFLRNGGNVRQLQVILGHSRLDMILTYTQLAEIDLQQAIVFSPVDNI